MRKNLKTLTQSHIARPYAEAAVWLPLDRTRERRSGAQALLYIYHHFFYKYTVFSEYYLYLLQKYRKYLDKKENM